MIKPETKEIINGLGTISVGCNGINMLSLTHINPPKEIGSEITGEVDRIYSVSIVMSENERDKAVEDLLNLTPNNPIAKLGGWTLDFSEFNKKSIDVYVDRLNLLSFIDLTLAC